jgi:hypothetical protein
MAHLFSDIRNMGWQTLYSNITLIALPRKNTSNHASHTRHDLGFENRGIRRMLDDLATVGLHAQYCKSDAEIQ